MKKFAIAVFFCAIVVASVYGDSLDRAKALHAKYPLVDGHNDLPWQYRQLVKNAMTQLDISVNQPRLQTDIPRLRQGGVGGQFWSVYVPCSHLNRDAVRATLDQVDVARRLEQLYPETFRLVYTANQIEEAFKAGKIASLIGMEGGHSIDNSLATLRMFYELGARYMTLTHNCHLTWVDSCCENPAQIGGLSSFGKDVIFEMNRLGMLVDISHVTPDVMHDVLEVSRAPVIFSHSSVYKLCPVARNVPDDVLLKLKQNRGVIMINFYANFVEINGNATLVDVANHIDYVKNLIGIDYVGLGADYDGVSTLARGLEDVSKYVYLTAELLDRGYTDTDIAKLIGGNVIRVLREAEEVAARLQSSSGPGEVRSDPINQCRVPVVY
eukprot:TRINITY_DN2501_c0_g1_i1.p1 TRINITY_DN2501_c0_g1~~TRINITY_DN2501_c0_g1_i1.p1  ORF type:complete len:382 (+),score=76.77 TRINITY_DN2501_c0_g1_i1:71-1216(+)